MRCLSTVNLEFFLLEEREVFEGNHTSCMMTGKLVMVGMGGCYGMWTMGLGNVLCVSCGVWGVGLVGRSRLSVCYGVCVVVYGLV